MDQLALGFSEAPLTRSRVTILDEETFEEKRTFLHDNPCGCLTCGLQHDGERWTNREPKPHVFLIGGWGEGGLLFCGEHIDAEVRRKQAERARR